MNSFQDNIFSIETLENSIRSDWQIHRWFLCLILTAQLRLAFLANGANKKHYTLLQRCLTYGKGLYLFILICFIVSFFKPHFLLLFIISVCLIRLCVLFRQTRESVTFLSVNLIKQENFPKSVECMTLYQLGEYFAGKYKIPSLIDVIYAQDSLQKKSVLVTIVVAFLYKIPVILFSLLLVWVVIFIINWPVFYKKLHRIVD